MPRTYRSLDQRLAEAQTAIDNALADATLSTALDAFGYDAARIGEGRALLDAARTEAHRTQQEYGDQLAASDAFRDAYEQANTSYMRHVKVARVALKGDRGAQKALGLDAARERSFAGWLRQARQFYENALGTPALLEKLGTLGITQEKLETSRTELTAAEAAHAQREQERGEAQSATQARNASADLLADWMSDFRAVARVALEEDPQQLEKLGIVVPS